MVVDAMVGQGRRLGYHGVDGAFSDCSDIGIGEKRRRDWWFFVAFRRLMTGLQGP